MCIRDRYRLRLILLANTHAISFINLHFEKCSVNLRYLRQHATMTVAYFILSLKSRIAINAVQDAKDNRQWRALFPSWCWIQRLRNFWVRITCTVTYLTDEKLVTLHHTRSIRDAPGSFLARCPRCNDCIWMIWRSIALCDLSSLWIARSKSWRIILCFCWSLQLQCVVAFMFVVMGL